MPEIGPNGPVFDETGRFLDNPSEKAAKSKNVTEIYWVPPAALAVAALVTFGGFIAAGWPIVFSIVFVVLFLLSIAAISWFSNRK